MRLSCSSNKGELLAYLERLLPQLEEIYSKDEVKLHDRPMEASLFFVHHCVVEKGGISKKEFLQEPWFKSLYKTICGWYYKKYGQAISHKMPKGRPGAILVFGIPFELDIPLIAIREQVPGKTEWMVFPRTVLPEETLEGFFVLPPNFVTMNAKDRTSILSATRKLVASIRSINLNCTWATHADKEQRALACTIPGHLYKAANDILVRQQEVLPVSIWELHMAVEKAIKLFLRQKGVHPPNTHDASKLLELALSCGLQRMGPRPLYGLPSYKLAISHRYGEGPAVSVHQVMRYYKRTLKLVLTISDQYKYQLRSNNAAILYKKFLSE